MQAIANEERIEALEARIVKAAAAAFAKGGRYDARFATLRGRLVKINGNDDALECESRGLERLFELEQAERDGCMVCGEELGDRPERIARGQWVCTCCR